MARFEEERPPAPRPPAPRPQPPAADRPRVVPNEADEGSRVERLLMSRWTPRLRLPQAIQRRLPGLPPEAKERLALISDLVQGIFGLILIFGAVAVVLAFLFRASVTEPTTAKAVLQVTMVPHDVSYSIETVRTTRLDGALVRQDTITGVQVDLDRHRFRVLTNGYSADQLRLAGDGRLAVVRQGDGPVQVFGCIPSACRGLPLFKGRTAHPYPPYASFAPVTAKDLVPLAGRLETNTATVYNQRGWQVGFHPTPTILLRLLQANLLQIDTPDVRAIRAGKYRVLTADASVVRRTHRLYQINVILQVNGAELHILLTHRRYNTGGLASFTLRRTPN